VEEDEMYRTLAETTRKAYRRRWKDNIEIEFREIGWVGMDWIDPTQNWDL
jgi:hypothetical protein